MTLSLKEADYRLAVFSQIKMKINRGGISGKKFFLIDKLFCSGHNNLEINFQFTITKINFQFTITKINFLFSGKYIFTSPIYF